MKPRLMDLVRCPSCRSRLDLNVFSEEKDDSPLDIAGHEGHHPASPDEARELYGRDIIEGLITCSGCELVFPIIDAIPRIIRNAYQEYTEWFYENRERIGAVKGQEDMLKRLGELDASVFDKRSNESFSLQWQNYQYGDDTWFKDDMGQRKDEFLDAMKLTGDELKGKMLLDAGCGNGRLTARMSTYGAEVVGMDLSRSVIRANQTRKENAGAHAPYLHFLQGNVMEPPLAEELFDHIHSSGVLHHTPSTERAFHSFLKLGKPGGRVYIQLYRKREAWVGIPNRIIRFFTCRMPVKMLWKICYWMAPVHRGLVLMIAKLRGEKSPIKKASRRVQTISLFDNYSPRYQYRYHPEEVHKMMAAEGLTDIQDVTFPNEARQMVAFLGNKGNAPEPAHAQP